VRLIVEPSGARDGGWSRRLCLEAAARRLLEKPV
jgi:hypothetical protein